MSIFKEDDHMHPMGIIRPYFIFEEDFGQFTGQEKNSLELIDPNEVAKVFEN